MKIQNPKISIIVPIYNGQDTIGDLVESIINQSYREWELILVDDGSVDSSGKLCDKFGSIDNRISVIHQNNMGLSGARNSGIKAANGEFITFVDADDLLLDGYLEAMVKAKEQSTEIDLVCCGYAIIESNNTRIKTYNTKLYLGKKEIKQLIGETHFLERSCVWGRLFRRKILIDNQLLFDEKLLNAEDRPFLYYFLIHTRGIATSSYVGYLYGNFSPNSNKNRYYPINVLDYRQLGQTEATRTLIDYYSIKESEVFYPLHHLMYIMLSTMESIYKENGISQKTVNIQKSFWKKYFDSILYKQLEKCPQWNLFLQKEKRMQHVVNGNFWKLNRVFLFKSLNLKIRLYVHNMLKKSKDVTFSLKKSISIINNNNIFNGK